MVNPLHHYQLELELLKKLELQRDMLETHEKNNALMNTNARPYTHVVVEDLRFDQAFTWNQIKMMVRYIKMLILALKP
jgi:hypothetical protein